MTALVHVTTQQVIACTAILVVMDFLLVLAARRWVDPQQFKVGRWLFSLTAGLFFLLVWVSVMLWGWDWFYRYIFPPWGRFLLPPAFALGYTLLSLGMSWLSLKLPGNPAVTWCVLGGLEGLLSHIYAIYGLGAASKPPIMQGSNPFSVLIFAVFEKAFYWSIILLVCSLVWRVVKPGTGKST